MPQTIKHITAAIGYIENHLCENPDLETIAKAVHYSKYHLHRNQYRKEAWFYPLQLPYILNGHPSGSESGHNWRQRALIVKDADTAIGIMALNERTGSITVTTFREGDRADTGYRRMFKSLGFAEAECLVEFGYPTQRLILRKDTEYESLTDIRKPFITGFCSEIPAEICISNHFKHDLHRAVYRC